MKVKEAAAMLEVSPCIVYGLVAAGQLRHYRVGRGRGVIRIAEEHVREYLMGAEKGPRVAAPPTRATPTKPYRLQCLKPRTA